jgi:putative transposase
MKPISFKHHRFPATVVLQAVRLYFRFTLSVRDVEELMAERGVEVIREAIRCWIIKFGPLVTANLHRGRPAPTGRRNLNEVVAKIGGKRMFIWRAVDDEGEVLDVLVQKRRNKKPALKLLRRLLCSTGRLPRSDRHRRIGLLSRRAEGLGPPAAPPPRRDAGEQSGRKLTPHHPTTRAKAAEVQIPRLSPAPPRQPRTDLQRL